MVATSSPESSGMLGLGNHADAGRWAGTLDGFGFVISRDDLGDLVLDFSGPAS